jgi:hypothetical protein
MLGKLLEASEFGQWASFVSPAFFEVMPTRALWQRFKALASSARDPELLARAVAERRDWLARSRVPVSIAPAEARRPASEAPQPGTSAASDRAAAVAALYFHQLLHGELTLLDLRAAAFASEAGGLVWRPAAWIARWDPAFISALRGVYTGFYGGDSGEFQAGLRALNLLHAEHVFRQHFGDGQGSVRFEVKHFVSTFHRVFVLCRDAKTRLHPDFLPLGLYLASLYDHLERLGAAVDVAAAFGMAGATPPAGRAAQATQAPA